MSRASTTPNSTSTYEYSHDPFDSFKLKVKELVHSLVKCTDVDIRRVRGGSYNRVVAAFLVREHSSLAGIFRIPRFSNLKVEDGAAHHLAVDERILDHAAVLQFLWKNNLPTPRLLAFDCTAANSIQSPYTFQTFSSGHSLASEYSNMTAPAKRSIADSLISFLTQTESIKFQNAGRLCVAPNPAPALKQSLLSDPNSAPFSTQVRGFRVDGKEIKPELSLYELLFSLINARVKKEVLEKDLPPEMQMWSKLSEILKAMKNDGFFPKPRYEAHYCVLYHWDLEPRNILIRPKEDLEANSKSTEWIVDEVIDWDDVYCVPPVLTRRPPVWLWDFCDDVGNSSLPSDYDGDVDLLPLNRYTAGKRTLSQDNQGIKDYFERKFVESMATIYPGMRQEDYQDQAYGGRRWIRRLARFAMDGASDNQDLKRFQRFAQEWNELQSTKPKTQKTA